MHRGSVRTSLPAVLGLILGTRKVFNNYLDVAEINQQRWLEEKWTEA